MYPATEWSPYITVVERTVTFLLSVYPSRNFNSPRLTVRFFTLLTQGIAFIKVYVRPTEALFSNFQLFRAITPELSPRCALPAKLNSGCLSPGWELGCGAPRPPGPAPVTRASRALSRLARLSAATHSRPWRGRCLNLRVPLCSRRFQERVCTALICSLTNPRVKILFK